MKKLTKKEINKQMIKELDDSITIIDDAVKLTRHQEISFSVFAAVEIIDMLKEVKKYLKTK